MINCYEFLLTFSSDSYNKSQRDALFLKFILVKNATCFGQTYCIYTSNFTHLQNSSITDTYCGVHSVETPDDGQVDLSEISRVLYQNKFEK